MDDTEITPDRTAVPAKILDFDRSQRKKHCSTQAEDINLREESFRTHARAPGNRQRKERRYTLPQSVVRKRFCP